MSVWAFCGMAMWWTSYLKRTEIFAFKIKHTWKHGPQYFQACYRGNKALNQNYGDSRAPEQDTSCGCELWFLSSLTLTYCLICASWSREISSDRHSEHISTCHLRSFHYYPAWQGRLLLSCSEPCSELIFCLFRQSQRDANSASAHVQVEEYRKMQ